MIPVTSIAITAENDLHKAYLRLRGSGSDPFPPESELGFDAEEEQVGVIV
jgi:hypothetical protein